MFMFFIGKQEKTVFADVASYIEPNASVLDLCAGDGSFYKHALSMKTSTYIGLEWNVHFVKRARRKGIDVRHADIRNASFPRADYVVMSGSLCHFHQELDLMINKMMRAARKGVIINEPIRNLSRSRLGIIRQAARLLSNPGGGNNAYRFTEQEFREAMRTYAPKDIRFAEGKKYLIAYFTHGDTSRVNQ
jgi:ubiquinone/menaquinone biosynthesis C-methylase UbiE